MPRKIDLNNLVSNYDLRKNMDNIWVTGNYDILKFSYCESDHLMLIRNILHKHAWNKVNNAMFSKTELEKIGYGLAKNHAKLIHSRLCNIEFIYTGAMDYNVEKDFPKIMMTLNLFKNPGCPEYWHQYININLDNLNIFQRCNLVNKSYTNIFFLYYQLVKLSENYDNFYDQLLDILFLDDTKNVELYNKINNIAKTNKIIPIGPEHLDSIDLEPIHELFRMIRKTERAIIPKLVVLDEEIRQRKRENRWLKNTETQIKT